MTDNGKTDKLKGKAKEVAGNVTGDDSKKTEGLLDQAEGKIKEVSQGAKDKVGGVVDGIKKKINE